MLYVVTLQAKCYYIMRPAICYIIDQGFHIIAMGLISTTGWARNARSETLVFIINSQLPNFGKHIHHETFEFNNSHG